MGVCKKSCGVTALAAAGTMLLGSEMVLAQGTALEEIVVTAQKREESLQDTPVAVSAFTASAIQAKGIEDISEVASFTPNLVFDTTSPISGLSSGAVVFIRGLGNTDFSLTTDPGVGTYVDGVYMSRSAGGVRSTARTVGIGKNTVLRLLRDAGKACASFQSEELQNLECSRIELDELWAFLYARSKNVQKAKNAPEQAGDIWTWTAIDPDSKLVLTWLVGDRSGKSAKQFLVDLHACFKSGHRVQITSDGHHPYLDAVKLAFGDNVDYGQLVKSLDENDKKEVFLDIDRRSVLGNPDPKWISTSAVERQNLTMRMSIRRYARRTNGFSKKIENHACALALHFMYYNFARLHRSINTTPAIAAGITDRLMSIRDIVRLTDEARPKPGPRGPYRKRKSQCESDPR